MADLCAVVQGSALGAGGGGWPRVFIAQVSSQSPLANLGHLSIARKGSSCTDISSVAPPLAKKYQQCDSPLCKERKSEAPVCPGLGKEGGSLGRPPDHRFEQGTDIVIVFETLRGLISGAFQSCSGS